MSLGWPALGCDHAFMSSEERTQEQRQRDALVEPLFGGLERAGEEAEPASEPRGGLPLLWPVLLLLLAALLAWWLLA